MFWVQLGRLVNLLARLVYLPFDLLDAKSAKLAYSLLLLFGGGGCGERPNSIHILLLTFEFPPPDEIGQLVGTLQVQLWKTRFHLPQPLVPLRLYVEDDSAAARRTFALLEDVAHGCDGDDGPL